MGYIIACYQDENVLYRNPTDKDGNPIKDCYYRYHTVSDEDIKELLERKAIEKIDLALGSISYKILDIEIANEILERSRSNS